MANFVRVKPAGWALNEIFTSAQANALDIDHVKAPNADDGSSHTPAAAVEIDGPGGIRTDLLALDGAANVENAATLTVQSGGTLQADAGAIVNVDAASDFNGDLRRNYWRFWQAFTNPTWITDYLAWSEANSGAGANSIISGGGTPRLDMTTGALLGNNNSVRVEDKHFRRAGGYTVEFVARGSSPATSVMIEYSCQSGTTRMVASSGQHGVGVAFDTDVADSNWTLVGMAGTTLFRSASSIAADGAYHRFRIEVAADGSAELFIDGTSEATLAAASVGTDDSRIHLYLEARSAAARTVQVESTEGWHPSRA